jgi:succinyl-CoA synthetase beta subunit
MPVHAMLKEAKDKGQRALSEFQSKALLAQFGVPVTREQLALSAKEAVAHAAAIGFPVALKACRAELMHKSEQDLVELSLRHADEVADAFHRIMAAGGGSGTAVLVQEMVPGFRELVVGLKRDPQFGPCIMLGIGGRLTEIIADAVFRMAPVDPLEVEEMIGELRANAILGEFRGQKAADRETLCRCLTGVGQIGLELEAVAEIDINPLIIDPKGRVKAADALVVLENPPCR